MFLEGIKVLVNEAREGNVGDYIVLPYNYTPESIKKSTTSAVEILDEDVDALVQIGAVSMIMSGVKMIEEENKFYDSVKQELDEDKEDV